MGLRNVYSFLLPISLGIMATQAAAERFDIVDAEGFERRMVAKTVDVPNGWKTSGRIAWNKPCSSNDLFETIFLTYSPDGRIGARIMPGYQFFQDTSRLAQGYPHDPFIAMMMAQSESSNREMASQFRGSNCAVADIVDNQTIVNTVILNNRPSDARIVALHQDEAGLNNLKNVFGAGMPGVLVRYDARVVEMQYNRGGVPTTEWLFLSWYNFTQEPFDIDGILTSSSHTVVEPLRLAWAPSEQALSVLPQVLKIFGSMRSAPDWQRRIDDIYRKNAEDRRKAQKEREAANDRNVRDFIDNVIWEGQRPGGSSGGSTELPSTGSDTSEETDVFGNPIPKTDIWGEPIKPEE